MQDLVRTDQPVFAVVVALARGVRRAARDAFPTIIGVLASDLDLEDKVREVIRVELDQLSRTPGLPGYVLSELHHHADRPAQFLEALMGQAPADVGVRVRQVLGAQIARAVRARMVQPKDCGDLIRYIANLPKHVVMNEVHLAPTHNRGYVANLQRRL